MHISKAVMAATVAAALPLAACQQDPVDPDLSAASTAPETTAREAERETEDPSESLTETTVTGEAADEYKAVEPSAFLSDGGYSVGGGSGVYACWISDSVTYPVVCFVEFAQPLPPVEDDGGDPSAVEPNYVWYKPDRGRFITAYTPGHDLYEPKAILNRGERVTVNGTTITHLNDGSFRVEHDGDAFEVRDGVYTRNGGLPQTSPNAVAKGEQCGTWNLAGQETGVFAIEDNTDCDIAMSTLAAYFDAAARSDTEGAAMLWRNPDNGWGCVSRYLLPGDADEPANRKVACTDTDMQGNKSSEGNGGVALLDPAEVSRL